MMSENLIITLLSVVLSFILGGVLGQWIKYRFFSPSVGEEAVWLHYQTKTFDFLEMFQKLNTAVTMFPLTTEVFDIAIRLTRLEDCTGFPEQKVNQAKQILKLLELGSGGKPTEAEVKEALEETGVAEALSEARVEFSKLYFEYKIYFPDNICQLFDNYIGLILDLLVGDLSVAPKVEEEYERIMENTLTHLAAVNAKKKSTHDLILRK
jgi:hypothetical protein